MSTVTAMAIFGAREASKMAKILDDDGKHLQSSIDKDRVAIGIASGIGPTQNLIDVSDTIRERGPRRISAYNGLKSFPEQPNAQAAMALKASGWPINSAEACATGLSAIVEGARLIKEGYADIAIVGGVEEILKEHKEVGIGLFAAMHVLSTRNEEPEKASRPFDKDRDGFVESSGIGVVVLESEEHARRRGAKIFAEALGFEKSIDGKDITEADPDRIANTIFLALRNRKTKEDFHPVDAIFAHATSTHIGDKVEIAALRKVFVEDLPNIPIAAIKSNLGHLMGAAGAVNAIAAIQSINNGVIPHILNLETPVIDLEHPDEDYSDVNLVINEPLKKDINTALVTALGFGGHNAVLLLGKYKG
jgi:3-oxoacyl-[acyl-carrier-protein] synthase II